jgi:AraC family transcriptional regulator
VRSYCQFHGARLHECATQLVHLSETRYDRRQRTARHAHRDVTLAFVVAGGFRERQGSRFVECGAAGLLLRPAGMEHEDVFADEGSACFNVEMTPELSGERPLAAGTFAGGRPEWLAIRLLIELREREEGLADPVFIEAHVAELVATLAPGSPLASIPDRVARVIAMLSDEPSAKWSLRDLAREADVHPVHLARAFRRHVGESVGQVLRRLRVERACRMLLETSSSLADIAVTTGFADQAHLTRVFRRHTGTTPARYRAALAQRRFQSFKT